MGEDADFAANPCCSLWKDKFSKLQHKYSKLEGGRTALRRCIELYERQIEQMKTEICNVKKAHEEERVHAENERKEKMKESVTRVSLENEISALKCEILSLREKESSEVQHANEETTRVSQELMHVNEELVRVNEELKLVRECDREQEMNQLRDQLQKARTEVESERRKSKAEKKRANDVGKNANAEKRRADEELKLKLARESDREIEMNRLRDQLQEARTEVESERRKSEAEKKRADEAWKKAEAEKSRADEDLKLKLARESDREKEMNRLRDQLQEARTEVESERRKSEAEKKRADEAWKKAEAEKSRADEDLKLKLARESDREKEMNRLRDQLQEARTEVEFERRKSEAENEAWKKAEAEKSRADEDLKLKLARESDREKEMNRLRDQLQEARTEVESERRKSEAENEAWKKAEAEKSRADEDLKLKLARESDREKEMNRLRDQLQEARTEVESERRKSEAEKKRADEAWKNAEAEKSRADEDPKLKLARESDREKEMNRLSDQLQEVRTEVESERRKSEAEKKRADDAWKKAEAEKSRADEELTLLQARFSNREMEMNLLREHLEKERTRADSEERKKASEVCEAAKSDKSGLERLEADEEKEEKFKESARLSVEDEISSLKSQILLLQQQGNSGTQFMNEELSFLQVRISEGETEMNRLKELFEKEKMRADSMKKKFEAEKKTAEAEKKKANEAWKVVKAEKCRVDEERRIADSERKKAEENRLQLEKLKVEADEARSNLVLETLKFEEANKKLEAERELVNKEKKRADLEKAKAEKVRKLAEISRQNALEEKNRADRFCQQLEEHRHRLEELRKEKEVPLSSTQVVEVPICEPVKHMIGDNALLKSGLQMLKLTPEESMFEQAERRLGQTKQKAKRGKMDFDSEMRKAAEQIMIAEAYKEKALEEKARADKLTQQLEENRRTTEDLRKQRLVLISPEKLDKPPIVPTKENMSAETAKLKLLRQELKLEKRQVKHAKQVAKLEKTQRKILQQELFRIKKEFTQFSHRLELCNCFTDCYVGTSLQAKNGYCNSKRKLVGSEAHHIHLQGESELVKPSFSDVDASDCFKQSIDYCAPMLPKSVNRTESTSGIAFKLQPLLRGSDRKTLHSSAIDSSMASFSDNTLVGSQERGAFSISKSAEWAEEKSKPQLLISRLSGEVNRKQYNTNCAVVAESNVRSPVDAVGWRVEHSKKRKRILNAVESVEHLFSDGEKWHSQIVDDACMLRHMLESQMGKPSRECSCLLANLQDNVYSKKDQHRKKRNTNLEEEGAIEHLCNSIVEKNDLGRKVVDEGNIYLQASSPLDNVTETARTGNEGIGESGRRFMDWFEEVVNENYMKLLDLDDSADEESYRLAIQRPLSPNLPEIEFKSSETVQTDDPNHSLVGCYIEKLSNSKDSVVPYCNFDTMDDYMDSNKAKFGASRILDSSKVSVNDEKSKSTSIHAGSSCVSQIQDCNVKWGISNIGEKGSTILCESNFRSTCNDPPLYCVVFSNISESSSLSKIFCTTGALKSQCPVLSQTTRVIRNLMSALMEVDNLLPKEKVCVFFSLLLHNCSWNFRNLFDGDFIHFLDLSVGHMMKVMYDVETRSILLELCILDELITLVEDFLVDRRVLMHTDGSAGPSVLSDQRVIQDNGDLNLSFQIASSYQLLCGAIALASLCAVFDRIGFLCEASYNVAQSKKFDSSVLIILHVFAYICGSKYFALSDYSLIMAVMKSLVTFRENENRFTGSASSHLFTPWIWTEFQPCTRCPFSEGAISIDVLTPMLLEKLQTYSCLHKLGVHTCQFNTDFDGTLYNLGDVLSSLELVASNMNWEWTLDNIVSPLLKMLESHVLENALAASLVLLGQLARFGINANGSEDAAVEDIKGTLCAFLSQTTARNVDLPVQIAAVSALLGTISLSFEEVIESNMELPEVASLSIPAGCIKKWFSLLTNEQKPLSYRLLNAR